MATSTPNGTPDAGQAKRKPAVTKAAKRTVQKTATKKAPAKKVAAKKAAPAAKKATAKKTTRKAVPQASAAGASSSGKANNSRTSADIGDRASKLLDQAARSTVAVAAEVGQTAQALGGQAKRWSERTLDKGKKLAKQHPVEAAGLAMGALTLVATLAKRGRR